jgi:hypothetical protein
LVAAEMEGGFIDQQSLWISCLQSDTGVPHFEQNLDSLSKAARQVLHDGTEMPATIRPLGCSRTYVTTATLGVRPAAKPNGRQISAKQHACCPFKWPCSISSDEIRQPFDAIELVY